MQSHGCGLRREVGRGIEWSGSSWKKAMVVECRMLGWEDRSYHEIGLGNRKDLPLSDILGEAARMTVFRRRDRD